MEVVVDDDPAPPPQPVVYVMSRLHELAGSGAATPSYGCFAVGVVTGGDLVYGDLTRDMWIRQTTESEGLFVEVGSLDRVLEQRRYGRDFSQSRGVDQFAITTASGARYQLVYWGGTECEDCPPASVEPLPGDPQGCGTPDAGGAP